MKINKIKKINKKRLTKTEKDDN